MSWAEYKKKREEQENIEMSYSQENNDSNNETSSWQKYKQKREEQKVQQTETLPVANKANTAPKTTTNLTEADLRKIEQNSGLKTGTLNLNKMQAQQQKFNNLQQKGNEELKSGAKLINEKQKKFNNFKNDAKIIGSNLKDSALSGGFQLLKTVGMMEDNAYNTQVDMRRILLENTINEREKRGLSTDELKEELNNSSLYKKSDVKPFYQEKINKINQRMAENTEKASNPVTKKIAGLSQSLGNNVVGGAVTAINPTAGFAYFTGSAMGSYYDEAVNERGMSDREARNYATIMGLMEGETDKYLAAENIKGLRKIMEGTGLKKSLESFGLEIGENFVQEAVMPAISELATKGIAGNEHLKYDFRTANGWKELARDSLSDGIDGALSAILLGGTTRGVASCVNLTNKARNGGKISKQEIKTAISDAQKSGVNVETILKDKIQENAKKRVLNLENETSGLPQNVQNNIEQQTIQTDTKTAQNQNMSQISDTNENNLKNTAINEINNSKISEQAKKDMLNAINGMENVDEESYNNIKQTLNEINKNELQTNSKYQDNLERRKNYVKYKDDINTYDNSAVEEVLSIIPTNRNGKRTVNQWLQVADEIGKRISGKSNAEIQEIAYKSWFENQPTKNITQYDSARKTSIGFQKLNSDMWVNKINEAVLKERTRLENTTNSQQVNFNNTQTNQESLFEDILNNKELPMQSYIYEKSDNPNVDILRKSASKYLNNSEQAHKFVQILEKISQDKNVEIRFDADLKTPEGKIANGSYSNGVITINPNSTRAGEFIAIHELTHAIGTKQMENIIEKYSKSNIEFNEETKKLLQNYSNTEMNEEALADISGQLFGTQEFINNISQNNPNVFQRIYSEIKYLWHQFKGYKTQDQFIDDLYYKWTQAYNGNNKLNNTENYHVSENFSSEIDKALNNKLQANTQVKARDYTPQILVDNGVDNLPMLITQRHIKSTIYTLQEAKNLGLPTKNVNYHGLGKDLLIKAIDNLDSPQAIYKTSENNYLVVTEFKDNNGKEIVIPIQINGNGRYNNVFIDENQIKSVYGRNNLNNYINKNNFEQIYKKNEELDFNEGIQYSNVANSSIKDSIAPQNENVNTTTKYSMQESENNSGSFNFDKNVKRYEDLQEAKAIKFNKKTDGTINIEITNDNELINQLSVDSKDNALKQLGSDIANYIYDNATEDSKTIRLKQTKNIEVHDTSHKGKQLEIIKKTNPMLDDYHVGIRNVEDIKAFNEVVNDEDSFVWGDFTREDAKKALKEGKITVYSSYPINQGTFVSTSKIQAEQYAGGKGNKIYSKTIPLEEVAWINGDEGQYANTTTRYSKNNQTWQDYLEKNYKTAGTRTNLEDIRIAPKAKKDILATSELTTAKQNVKNNSKQNKTIKQDNIQTEKNSLPTAKSKASATQSLPIGEYTGKQRKHYKSIMESAETTPQAKKIAKELLNSDTYVPETNKGQLERADARIMSSTPESELNSLSAKAINGEKISSVDIAVGERLIQYYSKTGNAVKLQEAIQTTAMAGTSAGQTVQALSLLNHQTPQGQAMWLQKSVDKMNNELARRKGGKISKDENGNIRVINNKGVDITEKVELFNLTPEMIQNVVSSKNDTELNNNLNKVYEQLGQQVTRTTAQKIDAWRYFSMLANPRTHIRNITGNVAMGGVQGIKNKVAGVIEGVANKINPDMERSHTIKPASKEVKAFAKADIENVTDRLGLSENKYNPKTRLENSMRTFKSDVMENTVGKMFDLNNKALEVEDGWGLKAGYAKALSEYMTANNLTPDTITDKQLGKARNYAIQQAKEATFHQDSSIASLLNQLSNKNKFSKFILDSTLPFKKTPINVAKAGLEYSPVGLVKSAINDTVQLRKGNITVNTYIDNISKGLTGSGIALVGYALADCGILKATGSDDEDREKFEESRGSQNYSVTIGDNTYSLDWLAPSGIPLFIGAECYELMQAQKEKKTSSSDEDELYNKAINTATNILDSFANAMNPMTEMSMLSGLTSALKSYDQDSSKMLASIGTNAVKSYVNQFVPTALGQVAKTTDQYERSTTSTQKGVLPKAIDTTRTQIMNKIPGLRQMLPIKTDIWGNEIEQSDNVIQRAFENAVFPWARKELNSNSVDKELVKVYKNTGDKAVLPDSINKDITINKQKYTMTSGEYSKYKKQYGENSYKLLNSLVTANGYKKMSDEEKRVAISKIYSYATEQIKVDYAKQNGLEYEQSTLSQVTNAIKKVNGNTSNYFEFIAKTQELDKDIEKIKTLANSNYDENTKKAIYENSLGKRDNKFNIMKETFTTNGLNTTKYLKYKSQEFESDKTDDGTLNGKTVNGSKKKKVWNYIEQMDITYTQKLLLYGLEYTPSNREQTQIVNYINSLPKTQQEKLEMLSKFQGFTIYKDGTFKY